MEIIFPSIIAQSKEEMVCSPLGDDCELLTIAHSSPFSIGNKKLELLFDGVIVKRSIVKPITIMGDIVKNICIHAHIHGYVLISPAIFVVF